MDKLARTEDKDLQHKGKDVWQDRIHQGMTGALLVLETLGYKEGSSGPLCFLASRTYADGHKYHGFRALDEISAKFVTHGRVAYVTSAPHSTRSKPKSKVTNLRSEIPSPFVIQIIAGGKAYFEPVNLADPNLAKQVAQAILFFGITGRDDVPREMKDAVDRLVGNLVLNEGELRLLEDAQPESSEESAGSGDDATTT